MSIAELYILAALSCALLAFVILAAWWLAVLLRGSRWD
jgi:hypothetical protein